MKYLCPRDFRRGEMEEKMNKDTSKNSNEKTINKFHFKKGNVKKSSSNKWNN